MGQRSPCRQAWSQNSLKWDTNRTHPCQEGICETIIECFCEALPRLCSSPGLPHGIQQVFKSVDQYQQPNISFGIVVSCVWNRATNKSVSSHSDRTWNLSIRENLELQETPREVGVVTKKSEGHLELLRHGDNHTPLWNSQLMCDGWRKRLCYQALPDDVLQNAAHPVVFIQREGTGWDYTASNAGRDAGVCPCR